MSPGLCQIARRNFRAPQLQERLKTPPVVACGNALAFQFPPGALVVFLCHSFGLPTLKLVLDRLESIPQAEHEMFFVYENPVYGEELDRRKSFQRWFARTVPAETDELPFHSGVRALGKETIVVWRRSSRERVSTDVDAHRKIVIEEEDWRATLL
uniref:hypothetical protein n=1 Tax=Rhodoblastus sp. TaxID=1962975 RepID=UPI003F9B2787